MGKEFNKKYMHPTRRKLLDMVHTGEYDKNTFIGYDKVEKKREVGEIWEDEHHRYEQKIGFIVKTGKNHEEIKKIRDYLSHKSQCKNDNCKTIKITPKDQKIIKQNGYCLGCTVENEHQIRVSGLWQEYQNYKIWTKMILVGKIKLDSYRQSIADLREEYQMINDRGQVTETWKLPKPIEEVREEINELIEYGEGEIKELEEKRSEVLKKLHENQFNSYL